MATLLGGNTLRIVESGINHDVDLSALAEDADADPNNEVSKSHLQFRLQCPDTHQGLVESMICGT